MKILRVEDSTWKKLMEIKIATESKSINEVIIMLLRAVNPFQTADNYKPEPKADEEINESSCVNRR